MPEFDDITLLKQFADSHSEAAFAVLVERYVHLVYSAALRQTGNPSHAEEITQAVFIILTQKAKSLGPRTILSGWLYQTARLTAANFLRSEIRRQQREQEAYMESLFNEPTPNVWQQIAPLLDDAMGQLSENDRNIVVLRFFQNKSAAEIGDALDIDSSTAQKRITRAVGRLRKYFAKRRVVHPADMITGTISTHSVQAAPALLAKSVTAVALAKGAVVSSTTLTLVKATLLAMKTKTIVATAVTAVVILGVGSYLVGSRLVHQPKVIPAAPASAAPSDTLPIKLANDSFKDPSGNLAVALLGGGNSAGNKFINEIDSDTRRTTNSEPAGHIKCLVAPTSLGSADYLNSLPSVFERGLAAARNGAYFVSQGSSLFGKRIRITGWMKTSDVLNWAGVNMMVANIAGHIFAVDAMFDRPVHGTTGWQQVEFVTDVPREPCVISLSPTLYGTGEMWCDDFQIDVVPANTPTTDDRTWQVWCQDPYDYSETTDDNVTHNGHPAVLPCLYFVRTCTQVCGFVVGKTQSRHHAIPSISGPHRAHEYLGQVRKHLSQSQPRFRA